MGAHHAATRHQTTTSHHQLSFALQLVRRWRLFVDSSEGLRLMNESQELTPLFALLLTDELDQLSWQGLRALQLSRLVLLPREHTQVLKAFQEQNTFAKPMLVQTVEHDEPSKRLLRALMRVTDATRQELKDVAQRVLVGDRTNKSFASVLEADAYDIATRKRLTLSEVCKGSLDRWLAPILRLVAHKSKSQLRAAAHSCKHLGRLCRLVLSADPVTFMLALDAYAQRTSTRRDHSFAMKHRQQTDVSEPPLWFLAPSTPELLAATSARLYQCQHSESQHHHVISAVSIPAKFRELRRVCAQLCRQATKESLQQITIVLLAPADARESAVSALMAESEASLKKTWFQRFLDEYQWKEDSKEDTRRTSVMVPVTIAEKLSAISTDGGEVCASSSPFMSLAPSLSQDVMDVDALDSSPEQGTDEADNDKSLILIEEPMPTDSELKYQRHGVFGHLSSRLSIDLCSPTLTTLSCHVSSASVASQANVTQVLIHVLDEIDATLCQLVHLVQSGPSALLLFHPTLLLLRRMELAMRTVAPEMILKDEATECLTLVLDSSVNQPSPIFLLMEQTTVECTPDSLTQRNTLSFGGTRELCDAEVALEAEALEQLARYQVELEQTPRKLSNYLSHTTTVVVDSRELRSELPAALLSFGLLPHPMTLLDGDYRLTAKTALERKAVPSDLIQSINSGRLQSQLNRLAKRLEPMPPMLLLESDPVEPFGQWVNEDDSSISQRVFALLGKLPVSHRRLRVLWSIGAHHAAHLCQLYIQAYGQNEGSVNIDDPTWMTRSEQKDEMAQRHTARQMLSRMPGVTPRNLEGLCKRVRSLRRLGSMSLGELTDAMAGDLTRASELYRFLHEAIH